MSLHNSKKCLIIPEKAAPPDWPAGWIVGGEAQPPGWPRKKELLQGKLYVDYLDANPLRVRVRCIDEFNEDTDALVGHLIQIDAESHEEFKRGKLLRVRRNDSERWTKRIAMQIAALPSGGWGIETTLQFEDCDAGNLKFSVFGHE